MKTFFRYALVGCGNTMVHWLCFAVLFLATQSQAASNLAAFCIAATLSYFVNARFTFKASPTKNAYFLFFLGMAAISLSIGLAADACGVRPIFTLVIFSSLSLVLGFLYAKYIVFKNSRRDFRA